MYNNAIPTYHRGERNYGTGYDMMKRIDALEEALALANAALRGCNMNMAHVEKKVAAALEAKP
jgi:hypothetical protein